jgi:hypothetical protein
VKKLVVVFLVLILFVFSFGCARRTSKVQYGSVTIDSVPQGAEVSIDGVYRGKTPLSDYLLPAGKHEVVLTAKAYKSLKKEISVNSNGEKFSFSLEKIPNQCVVTINTKDRFMVVVDKHCLWKFTDKPLVLTKGKHEIQLINFSDIHYKDYFLIGTFDIEKDTVLNETDFKNEKPQFPEGQLFASLGFASSVPVIRCCSAAAYTYSGIYVNETVTVKGYTKRSVKAFYIVFPSGKKIEIDTINGNCDECTNYFEKEITFDEPGYYTLKNRDNPDEIVSPGFHVFYKAKPLSHIIKVKDLFSFSISSNTDALSDAIVVFEGEAEKVKFLITDANGKVMRNTPIGAYGLKTDANGVVTFTLTGNFSNKKSSYGCCGELYVNGKRAPVLIYGDVEAQLVRKRTVNKKYEIKKNRSVYLPAESALPCMEYSTATVNINGKQYVDIASIESSRFTVVKETQNAYIIYGLITMVP